MGEGQQLSRASRSLFVTVWLTLFLDLVGFGIVLPVLPFYAEHFGASVQAVTLLSASFSLAQFAMAPVLGRIGDRFGRRPVMLISIAGSCASMLVLSNASALWMVFAARVVSGMSSANVGTAQAYVADRVGPEQRAKYMGIMGSAIGLGFVVGPAIGGLLSVPSHPGRPFVVAAVLGAINWGFAFLFLPKTQRSTEAADATRMSRSRGVALREALRGVVSPALGGLVLVNFLLYFAFSAMQSTFALSMEARFFWGAQETGLLFTCIGFVIVAVQGVVVGRLVSRLGEKWTLVAGMAVLSAGLAATGAAPTVATMVLGTVGIAAGNGLASPTISALVSRVSRPDQQGLNLGLTSSAASLARIAGPALAGVLFAAVGPGSPMVAGGGLLVVAVLCAWALIHPARHDNT